MRTVRLPATPTNIHNACGTPLLPDNARLVLLPVFIEYGSACTKIRWSARLHLFCWSTQRYYTSLLMGDRDSGWHACWCCCHALHSAAKKLLKKNWVLSGGRKLISLCDSTYTKTKVSNVPSSTMLNHKVQLSTYVMVLHILAKRCKIC